MTKKQAKVQTQIESVEQETALVVPPATDHQPVESPVQAAEQSAGKIVGEPPPEKSLEERVEKLIDFLIYVDGTPIPSSPKELAEEFGLTTAQFNSVRRQLAARGVTVKFMRKGRRPLVDVAKYMDDPQDDINLVG